METGIPFWVVESLITWVVAALVLSWILLLVLISLFFKDIEDQDDDDPNKDGDWLLRLDRGSPFLILVGFVLLLMMVLGGVGDSMREGSRMGRDLKDFSAKSVLEVILDRNG